MILTYDELKTLHCLIQLRPHQQNFRPIKLLDSLPKSLSEIQLKSFENVWKNVPLCLLHLGILQSLCNTATGQYSKENSFSHVLFSADLWSVLTALCRSDEQLITWSAKRLVSAVLCTASKAGTQHEWVEMTLNKLFASAAISDSNFFAAASMLTVIAKQLEQHELDIFVTSQIVYNLLLYAQEHAQPRDSWFAHMLDLTSMCSSEKSPQLQDSYYQNAIFLIENYKLIITKPLLRLKYLKVLYKALQIDSVNSAVTQPRSLKVAEAFLHAVQKANTNTDVIFKPESAGFGGRKVLECESNEVLHVILSESEIMLLTNCTLRAMNIAYFHSEGGSYTVLAVIEKTINELFRSFQSEKEIDQKLLSVFFEQDDLLIELLSLHLQVNNAVHRSFPSITFLFSPHSAFLDLTHRLSYDSSVLLDWLTSDETSFLSYFLKYLKYAAADFDGFCSACELADSTRESRAASSADSIRVMLVSLTSSIDRLAAANLFPYTPKPLRRNVDRLVSLLSQSR